MTEREDNPTGRVVYDVDVTKPSGAYDGIELIYGTRAPTINWVDRVDPVHEVHWSDMVNSSWETMSYHRNQLRLDATGHLIHDVVLGDSPIIKSDRSLYNAKSITAMSMLAEWNQLSTLQLATMMGMRADQVGSVMWTLHAAGMVKKMTPYWWKDGMHLDDSGSGSFWRIDRKSWTTQKWYDGLGNLEWFLSTNGVDPLAGTVGGNSPLALRHNVATIEVALKAMEACPGVIGAYGEAHCHSNSFYDASSIDMDATRNNVGDAIIMTRDGKIIILESAGTNASMATEERVNKLVDKAAAWVSVCGRSVLDIYVLFIDISRNPRPRRIKSYVDFGVKKVSPKYVSNNAMREKGQHRVFVVDSREWFPITRSVSTNFKTLRVWSPMTGSYVDLAPLDLVNTPIEQDYLINSLAALHTPTWIHGDIREHEQ